MESGLASKVIDDDKVVPLPGTWSREARADLLCGVGGLAVCSSSVPLADSLGPSGQLVLALGIGLVAAVRLALREDALVRTQTLVVFVSTSAVEVAATRWLGLWDYRLGSPPAYIPVLHAVIFLAVLMVTRSLPPRLPRRPLLICALVGVGLWATNDLLLSARTDTVGVPWFLVLLVLCRHFETAARIPAIVALTVPLDILTTCSGTVVYRPHDVTGLLSMAALPSAIVGGYALIYCLASLTAPWLLSLWRRAWAS
ncbi:hypothetical protein [Streptomyces acidiscabies]|uniref:Uncharacterized protein n=1 Tax=Streptomyces acidiscabies TaxID=42234 RepID=A0AAP6BET3_9ACTN|nr:hypothetical protein [Streptomyces acidiscabies]MBZ3913583.1 hypothetical protein [Streptomyces acidiscabies]MDX2963421.1 hypothetical protein [Streptomyces acidiscabies]MDX3023155.1 hypothetical protein [Streptomyces acidiscabies]MDX3792701.1 hypothetical protein [Streptomyces acidiscabies]GAQ51354.1 hypothetical protein a10_01134 [Streptomyces acidiscabies]